MTLFIRKPPCGGFPWGTRQNWTLTSHEFYDISNSMGMINYVSMESTWIVACIGVNIFVLISGYFLSDNSYLRIQGGILIWFETIFYSLFGFILALLINHHPFSISEFLSFAEPIHSRKYWFVTVYLGLILIAPFLSKLLTSLTRKQYCYLLAVTSLMSFQFLLSKWYAGEHHINWFIFLFFVSGYLKRFGVPIWIRKNIGKIVFVLFLCLFTCGLAYNILNNGMRFNLVSTANDGFIFFLSVSIFIWFLQRDMDTWIIRKIVLLAPYCLGIYLIHEHPLLGEELWLWIIPENYNVPIILHAMMYCILIFIVCSSIDYFRRLIFRLLKINRMVKYIASKIPQPFIN